MFLFELGVLDHLGRGRGQRAEQRQRQAGAAAGRVQGDLGRLLQPADAIAVLVPSRQAGAPSLRLLCRKRVGLHPLPPRLLRIHPGRKIRRAQIRKGQQQVAQVPLGIDDQGGDAVDGRLLEQSDPQPCLPAAGHAHQQAVRDQISSVEQQRLRPRLMRARLAPPAQVKQPQLLVVLHGFARCPGRSRNPVLFVCRAEYRPPRLCQ